MEENKNGANGINGSSAQEKKLSYEELKALASDLDVRNQRLVAENQKMLIALNDRDFDYMSFFLQMLFKVIEHKQAYKPEFGKWAADNIQSILTSFAASIKPQQPVQADDTNQGTAK